MHLVVADDQMQPRTFQRLLTDFPPEREGIDLLIERMREGKDINVASDGSRLVGSRASAGWLLWTMSNNYSTILIQWEYVRTYVHTYLH